MRAGRDREHRVWHSAGNVNRSRCHGMTETSSPPSSRFHFTSESVCEGHPDKICDYIADSVLDAYLAQDPRSRVACEVLAKSDTVVVAGEVTSSGSVDQEAITRQAIREVGYAETAAIFCADTVRVIQLVSCQAPEIARSIDLEGQGAGDQGQMFGYATTETPELMPLPVLLAHRITRQLADDRKSGRVDWLGPDGKAQVTVSYEDHLPVAVSNVVVSTQHASGIGPDTIRAYIDGVLLPRALDSWFTPDILTLCNPSGSFIQGGPTADCGLTGRKNIVDTYGGAARHGGGSLSGKDPSKVDRSAAYFSRYVARQIVKQGIATRAEVQVAYAIGVAAPVSLMVDTFGSGEVSSAQALIDTFDFRPAAIIERLSLLNPIYRQTTNYGHFGRPGLPWEA